MKDVETQVCKDIKSRQKKGIKKYGRTVAEASEEECMLTHAYEEALDLAIYLKAEILKRKYS